MNREIKFRGQRIDTKEWVYGNLIKLKNTCFIFIKSEYDNLDADAYLNECCFKVIPETVGQFTGLKDKNRKEIYEGDINNIYYNNCVADIDIVCFGEYYQDGDYHIGFYWLDSGHKLPFNKNNREFEIIGNIHTTTKEQLKEWNITL